MLNITHGSYHSMPHWTRVQDTHHDCKLCAVMHGASLKGTRLAVVTLIARHTSRWCASEAAHIIIIVVSVFWDLAMHLPPMGCNFIILSTPTFREPPDNCFSSSDRLWCQAQRPQLGQHKGKTILTNQPEACHPRSAQASHYMAREGQAVQPTRP